MTVQDILAQVASGKLTPDEAAKLMPSPGGSTGFVCKFNQSGGVFIKHPKFIAHSATKNKDYNAGINLDAAVARVLFTDESVLAEVVAAVRSLLGGK